MSTLVTGVSSGLGKYLHENLFESFGLNRDNFDEIKDISYELIIHCAFNKENDITDYKKYLDDNIFLTQRLKKLKCRKFVYISTVDVYQESPTIYSHFKRFSETLLDSKDLILRCPMMIGDTMKINHLVKIKNNYDKIGLSKESTFNYILMEELLDFFVTKDFEKYEGIVDFISNDVIRLENVKELFNSQTIFGDHIYKNDLNVVNPIFKLDSKYDKPSLEKIKKYFK
jgi:hypothetical protein